MTSVFVIGAGGVGKVRDVVYLLKRVFKQPSRMLAILTLL